MKHSNTVVKGIIWSAIDKIAVIILQLVIEIVLARLLLPAEYGLIGMTVVFFAIAQVFVDGGFMNALIQKQDNTEIDFSTVFYTSLIISIIVYWILFFAAPFISLFYNSNQLTNIIRISGINIILNSFALIHRTKLSISMNFKIQAQFSVVSMFISGILGIYLAYTGYGVWALVFQSVCLSGLNTILLVIYLKWRPMLIYSKESFHKLFGFGSKLLLAGLIQNTYSNLYSFFIGKVFTPRDLGIYTKSTQFTLYPAGIITNLLQRVMYPYLSRFQNNDIELFRLNKQYYTIIAILFFPLFTGLCVLAEPFIKVLLSERWIDSVPIIRTLAIAFLFFPFINVNMFIFQIKGMSTRFLTIEVFTKVSGIIILVLTLKYNVFIMSCGLIVQNFLQLLITSYFSDKSMNSKKFSQFRLLIPMIIISLIIAFLTYQIIKPINMPFLQLIIGFFIIISLYLTYYFLFMKETVVQIREKLLHR